MVTPTLDHLAEVQRLYDAGRLCEAYRRGTAIAPPETWRGAEGRVLASRLLSALGATRAGGVCAWLGWREWPQHPQALIHAAYERMSRLGPLAAWQMLNRHEGCLVCASAQDLAEFWLLRSQVSSVLRDFVTAERYLQQAWTQQIEQAWWHITAARLRSAQGNHKEALDLARRCLDMRPWYWQGVHAAACELMLLSRADEAAELVGESLKHVESPLLARLLAALHEDAGHHEAALEAVARFESLSPRLEREAANWAHSSRAHALYCLGRHDEAADSLLAMRHRANEEKEAASAASLAASILGGRGTPASRRLDVRFICQEHDTCAPTSMAMLCAYWGRPVNHLSIAEDICYGGTPGVRQRQWAATHGWLAREFTLTAEAASALIDRGIPFAMTTVEPDSGHMMVVAGYDRCAGSVLLRDPGSPLMRTWRMDALIARYAAFGPLCLVIWPADQPGALDGVELPDADLCDLVFHMMVALESYDRDEALSLLAEMERRAPGHRISLHARLSLSNYDHDAVGRLTAVDRLLDAYPECMATALYKVQCLRDMERRSVWLDLLETLSSRVPGHPAACSRLAGDLVDDARSYDRCRSLLRQALRRNPGDADALKTVGRLQWNQGRYSEALEAYRFAMCLKETDESLVQAYFGASRHLKLTDEAMAYLRERFERFGRASSGPAMSLFWAEAQLERADRGLADLDRAVQLRPDDSDLALYAAERHAAYGRFDRADELLGAAAQGGHAHRVLRARAYVAMCRSDLKEASDLWAQVCRQDPQDTEAISHAARLRAQTVSPEAAQAFLAELAEMFPHNMGVLQQQYLIAPEEQHERRLAALDRLLTVDSDNVWALQQKTLVLLDMRRSREALETAKLAHARSPETHEQFWVEGLVFEAGGNLDGARERFRRSIVRNVSFEPALRSLIRACATPQERHEALGFIENQIVQQSLCGGGLMAYWSLARGTVEPRSLLESLRRVLNMRPDLWEAHSVVSGQHLLLRQYRPALEVAHAAVKRFPLVPRLWMDLAAVHRVQEQEAEELAALGKAMEVAPGSWDVIRMVIAVHERRNDLAAMERESQRGIECEPLQGEAYASLAQVRLQQGRLDEVPGLLERALRLAPRTGWIWSLLGLWGERSGQCDRAVAIARQVAEWFPGDATVQMGLASYLNGAEHQHERMRLLNTAIELSPRLVEAYSMRADLLSDDGRTDAARESLKANVWGPQRPVELKIAEARTWLSEGELVKASFLADEVIAAAPHSVDAYLLKAQCAETAGDAAAYLKVCREAFELDPTNATLVAILGRAHSVNSQPDEARRLWTYAAHLAPTYLYPHLCLLDQLLADRNCEGLHRLIERLEAHFPPFYALSARSQTAMVQGDVPAAVNAFKQALTLKRPDPAALSIPLRAILDNSSGKDLVRGVLVEAFHGPNGSPVAARLWVEAFAASESYGRFRAVVREASISSECRLALVTALCRQYGDGCCAFRKTARVLVRDYGPLLRSNNEAWAQAAHALTRDAQYEETRRWTSDWQQRAVGEAWMLLPIATASITCDDMHQAVALGRAALAMPRDSSTAMFEAILAWSDSFNAATAARTLGRARRLSAAPLWPLYRLMADLAMCVAKTHASPVMQKSRTALQMIREADQIWRHCEHRTAPVAQRLHSQATKVLARHLTPPQRAVRSAKRMATWAACAAVLLLIFGIRISELCRKDHSSSPAQETRRHTGSLRDSAPGGVPSGPDISRPQPTVQPYRWPTTPGNPRTRLPGTPGPQPSSPETRPRVPSRPQPQPPPRTGPRSPGRPSPPSPGRPPR
ncbi:MAG: hypothetical protein GXY74_13525 [Phycisphaerae bacterium]|nr:hypothetical protein [Phycisphaerae bacterium]